MNECRDIRIPLGRTSASAVGDPTLAEIMCSLYLPLVGGVISLTQQNEKHTESGRQAVAELTDEVAHMLAEWENSGELYRNFAERLTQFVLRECAKNSALTQITPQDE